MNSKKELTIILSRLKLPKRLGAGLEQYLTPVEIASDILWTARKDIKDKVVADFGCGNGILGIGAALIGAKTVFLVDISKEMIKLSKLNASEQGVENAKFINADVTEFVDSADMIIQNPPFGLQKEKNVMDFIDVAFQSAKKVYSLHPQESERLLIEKSRNYGFSAVKLKTYNFVTGHSFNFKDEPTKTVKADLWVFTRK